MSDLEKSVLSDEEINKLMEEHNKGGAFKQNVPQSCWDAGIVVKPGCAHMEMPKYHVYFSPLAHQKIKKLQSYYPTLEWLAYLEGVVDREKQEVSVTDLVIPDSQQVTGVNVYNVEYSWNQGRRIIGVIHSHHGMGAFFSGTDDAYINQNHDVSIVVSTNPRSPIKGQVRVKAPCGEYVLAENENVTFSVKYPQVLDEAEFEKEFVDKIKRYTPVVTYVGNGYLGNYGSYYGRSLGVNSYYGRYSGNPPRGGQTEMFEDDPYDIDVDSMTKMQVREELEKFYTEAEVDEFFENGEAEEELKILLGFGSSNEDDETIEIKEVLN